MLPSKSNVKSNYLLLLGLSLIVASVVARIALSWTMYQEQHELSIEAQAQQGLTHEFVQLAERFPDRFELYFPSGVTTTSYAEALRLGRAVYVAEACWHCHTQQVRSVSKENQRWGPVSHDKEYMNELQRPALFGTRRVGPDLAREGGRRSNDWHLAHFYQPTSVVPTSVMPSYRWFYDEDGYPNKQGLAILAYVQSLGSQLPSYPYYFNEGPSGQAKPSNKFNTLAHTAD